VAGSSKGVLTPIHGVKKRKRKVKRADAASYERIKAYDFIVPGNKYFETVINPPPSLK
jgi:hypothetical protein